MQAGTALYTFAIRALLRDDVMPMLRDAITIVSSYRRRHCTDLLGVNKNQAGVHRHGANRLSVVGVACRVTAPRALWSYTVPVVTSQRRLFARRHLLINSLHLFHFIITYNDEYRGLQRDVP